MIKIAHEFGQINKIDELSDKSIVVLSDHKTIWNIKNNKVSILYATDEILDLVCNDRNEILFLNGLNEIWQITIYEGMISLSKKIVKIEKKYKSYQTKLSLHSNGNLFIFNCKTVIPFDNFDSSFIICFNADHSIQSFNVAKDAIVLATDSDIYQYQINGKLTTKYDKFNNITNIYVRNDIRFIDQGKLVIINNNSIYHKDLSIEETVLFFNKSGKMITGSNNFIKFY